MTNAEISVAIKELYERDKKLAEHVNQLQDLVERLNEKVSAQNLLLATTWSHPKSKA